ncbi:MAG: hypothetical protein U9Q35_01085 [Pseudomonadota bacterium]|nr:hypothetical protein [Pseudomonadota bacterium]
MSQLNNEQLARLARRGIAANEYTGAAYICLTADGERYYTADDLARMAQPSAVERFKNWVAGVAA